MERIAVVSAGRRRLGVVRRRCYKWHYLLQSPNRHCRSVRPANNAYIRYKWAAYHYTLVSLGGSGQSMNCLTSVDYSDGQHAYYTYTTDNQPDHPNIPCPCTTKILPLVQTCQDVRYKGPMRQICYEYQDQVRYGPSPHGAIIAERYSLNSSTDGPQVSWIDPPAPSPLLS